jgi:hypothetical protein
MIGEPISVQGKPATCRYGGAPSCSLMRIEGPAIIEEKTSTIVLHPGQHAEVDTYLNIEIEQPR